MSNHFDILLIEVENSMLIHVCYFAVIDLSPNSEAQKHFQTLHPPVRVLIHVKEYYKHGCHNILNFAIRRMFSCLGLLTNTYLYILYILHHPHD